jgi:hypothetical protein
VVFDGAVAPFRRLELADELSAAVCGPVDLVALGRAPIELVERVLREGVLLYAASTYERVEFEASRLALASDLAPMLREQRREIVAGGPHDRAMDRYRTALAAARRVRRTPDRPR